MPWKEPHFERIGEVIERILRNSVAGQLMKQPTLGSDLLPTFGRPPGDARKPVEGSESVVVRLEAFRASKGLPETASDEYGASGDDGEHGKSEEA